MFKVSVACLMPLLFTFMCQPVCSVKMDSSELVNSYQNDLLTRNENLTATWTNYEDGLKTTQTFLKDLPLKMSHYVMVPLGPKALIPGKIVHTNELLVNIGDSYFVKQTANQAWEFCQRKLVKCDEMLKNLESERDLFLNKMTLPNENDAFGNDERPEIVEHVTVEEDLEWRKVHRQKEKEYNQKLAKIRNEKKEKIESEEDLWKRLDQLELEEELEDELNRLHDGCASEGDDEDDSDSESVKSENEENLNSATKTLRRRSVTFKEEEEAIVEEVPPLILHFKHSPAKVKCTDGQFDGEIKTPGDIRRIYIDSKSKYSKSILKVKKNPNLENELAVINNKIVVDESSNDTPLLISSGVELPNVIESNMSKSVESTPPVRKISKFKAQRMKK